MPVTPSDQEDEYFARQEFERRKREMVERDQRVASQERERILSVARGRCPKCAAGLVTVTFRGVELDKCSECGGLWFDCGELDRVLADQAGGGFLTGIKRIFG
jgi:hypothetical protein